METSIEEVDIDLPSILDHSPVTELSSDSASLTEPLSKNPNQYLYAPNNPAIAFLLHRVNERGENDYTSRFVSVVMYSGSCALLQMHLPTGDQCAATSDTTDTFILDLAAKITKIAEERDRSGAICMISYLYIRFEDTVAFDVLPILPEQGLEQLQVFDFILSQFTWFSRSHLQTEVSYIANNAKSPNAIAKGFERAGTYFRRGLKSAGKGTGTAIRYLGKKYTDTTLQYNKDRLPVEVNDAMITKVEKRQEAAESVHATMRSVTSTILLPVRHMGKKAQEWTVSENVAAGAERNETSELNSSSTRSSALKRGMYDTAAGLGNGLANAFKGVTEFVEEVGKGIGDSALHHSKEVYGTDYCEKITTKQVEAAGHIGLGMYKVGNVASFGIAGLMVDVIVEGTVISQLLLEFLQGPILLMGRFLMTQIPQQPKEYLVVLRPWSLAFYSKSDQIASKPDKIIPTSMLDTLPLLRVRKEVSEINELDTAGHGFESGIEHSSTNSNQSSTSLTGEQREADMGTTTIGDNYVTQAHKPSLMTRMKGGNRSHIEICTVDCSVYLLYPPSEDLQIWHEELKAASVRVETVEKKRSGALELALARRLRIIPKNFIIDVHIHQLIVQSEEEDVSPGDETAPKAPSLMRRMADTARNSTLTAAKVKVAPVGKDDVKLSCEEKFTSEVPLISGSNETMFASFLDNAVNLPFSTSSASSDSIPPKAPFISSLSLGHDYCISPDEIDSILITARVSSIVHGYIELGRASVNLASLLGETEHEEFFTLKLRRKKSNRVVGTLTCSIKTSKYV